MTTFAPATWRDHADQLTPRQVENLAYADHAWTDRPELKAPFLLGLAGQLLNENAVHA